MGSVGQRNSYDEFGSPEASGKRQRLSTSSASSPRGGQPDHVSPIKFIQHIAGQVQLLACLKWLGEFQILALIPLRGSVQATEVAGLAGVSASQLCRVVRMTATKGFLQEPRSGQLAHTQLSAPFVTRLSLLDSIMFLAESATPSALHMATETQNNDVDTSYRAAFRTSQPFRTACAQQERLQRQWKAYRQCAGETDEKFVEVLGKLNWRNLGGAGVVDVCAQSTKIAVALAEIHPGLHLTVQLDESESSTSSGSENGARGPISGRVKVQKKMRPGVQPVKDAVVYILRLTKLRPTVMPQLVAELNTHLEVLQENRSATLIVAPPLLPEPGTLDPDSEAAARLQDLSNFQLMNECAMELCELLDVIRGVRNAKGRLVVENKLRYRNGAVAAVSVKFQSGSSS